MNITTDGSFNGELLESIFRTSKKTIQEYVREIERNNRYKSVRGDVTLGTVLDDRRDVYKRQAFASFLLDKIP